MKSSNISRNNSIIISKEIPKNQSKSNYRNSFNINSKKNLTKNIPLQNNNEEDYDDYDFKERPKSHTLISSINPRKATLRNLNSIEHTEESKCFRKDHSFQNFCPENDEKNSQNSSKK